MPTLAPDTTPSDVAYGSRQGQPAPVSPALAHQFSLSEFAALKTQLASQAAEIAELRSKLVARDAGTAALKSAIPQSDQSEITNLKSEISSPRSALATPRMPDPQSEILNLKSEIPDPPCPRSTDPAAPRLQCAECDAQLCPSRIAVPIFTGILKRTQKCDGACRFCSPKRQKSCPYTLPKYRDGPKV